MVEAAQRSRFEGAAAIVATIENLFAESPVAWHERNPYSVEADVASNATVIDSTNESFLKSAINGR